MTQNDGFVGLDVGKFEIYVFISKIGLSFSVPNTSSGHARLLTKLGQPRGQIIALEPTGGYEWVVWEVLDAAGYDVRQVSAAHVCAFVRRLMRSRFSRLKKLSATALSRQFPRLLILYSRLRCLRNDAHSILVNCEPWSELISTLSVGLRRQTAISNA